MTQVPAELTELRASIDNLDRAVICLLAERFKITQQVGHLKAEHGLPPADPSREARQIARLRSLAEDAKLDPEFAEKFLNFIIAEVAKRQAAEYRFYAGADPERAVAAPCCASGSTRVAPVGASTSRTSCSCSAVTSEPGAG